MCYMNRPRNRARAGGAPGRVGVRELRQNLSVYLEHIAATGEGLEVTDRGRPVAMLVPLPSGGSLVDRLVSAGRATPAAVNPAARVTPPPVKLAPDARRRVWSALEDTREERL